jgi:hypothetical protein
MPDHLVQIGDQRCLIVDSAGAVMRDASAGQDLVEEALNHRASIIAVPVERLDPAFFRLRSLLAGEVIQKVMNYRCKFAVVGDISMFTDESNALRDFVVECNRGRDVFFVADIAELEKRLTGEGTTE